MQIKNVLVLALIAGLLVFCKPTEKENAYSALRLDNMDTTVNPADDFYNFVNGKWMKRTTIPDDKGRWGAFEILDKTADSQTLAVLMQAQKNKTYAANTDQGKAIVLFECALDSINRNKDGINPVKPYIAEINACKNIEDINSLIKKYASYGESTFWSIGVDADMKNSNVNSLYLQAARFGLPDRDYYLNSDVKSIELQNAYKKFVSELFADFGIENAEKIGEKVFNIEKKLAAAKLTKEQMRQPTLLYNKYSLDAAKKMLSNFSLQGSCDELKINADTIIIPQINYIKTVNSFFTESNIADVKLLYLWGLIRGSANTLTYALEEKVFNFYGKTMRGTMKMKPRKEIALDIVNNSVGEALGKVYVDKYFSADAKKVAMELVQDLISAYRVRINNLSWMSAETKAKAQKKLDKLTIKIGYPDKWKDYGSVQIKSYAEGGSLFTNSINAGRYEVLRNAAKYGKPVDKSEWLMTPQTVNAYYNPPYNEIVFPAAILQAPFFDFKADAAVNYGGIGAVIGHEISHGFDDEGSQYDENGNLVNWWSVDDAKNFKSRGEALIQQFNAFEPLKGKFVNGTYTLGENIGDLGGVNSAYDALQINLKRTNKTEKINGFTQEQRFFISWATVWCNKIRDKELETRLATDPHSPGYYRAIGPLQNLETFYAAFNVKKGNKMWREEKDRVKIW